MIRRAAVLALVALLALAPLAGADVQSYTFTPAQMEACNTSPITLLPATAGVAYLPVRALGRRAGDAYATQSGDVLIRYAPPVPGVHMRLDLASGGLLTQRRVWLAFAPNAGRYGAEDSNPIDIGGKAVELFCSVGNPTTTLANPGSEVHLELHYEVWPTVLP